MKLSIVIPTITGKEASLQRTKAAYIDAKPQGWEYEFIVVKNAGNAGKGWNRGADQASGDYLHFTADDILPHPGWLETAYEASEDGEYPAPRIVFEDGTLQGCGGLHGSYIQEEIPDGTAVQNSQLPFFRAELWEEMGPGLPIHYWADDYLSERAVRAGLTVVFRKDYAFTHMDGHVRDPEMLAEAQEHQAAFWRAMSELVA